MGNLLNIMMKKNFDILGRLLNIKSRVVVFLTGKGKCENCGKPIKSWFKLCVDCNNKEKQKPTCEVCGVDVPEKHNLCKTHWLERKRNGKHPLENYNDLLEKLIEINKNK